MENRAEATEECDRQLTARLSADLLVNPDIQNFPVRATQPEFAVNDTASGERPLGRQWDGLGGIHVPNRLVFRPFAVGIEIVNSRLTIASERGYPYNHVGVLGKLLQLGAGRGIKHGDMVISATNQRAFAVGRERHGESLK